MAVICVAGVAPGIGKTAVAEMLLDHLPGWHAARVRLPSGEAEAIPVAWAERLADAGYVLAAYPGEGPADAELDRLLAAGAASARLLVAEPRGLAAGLEALARSVPAGGHLLVEGNAYLWAAEADLAIMVVGPGPSGRGLARVRASARDLFPRIGMWVWNSRGDPAEEGFFEFPQALARMGFREAVSNRADFHAVNALRQDPADRDPLLEAVVRRLEAEWVQRGSREFLRRIGFQDDG